MRERDAGETMLTREIFTTRWKLSEVRAYKRLKVIDNESGGHVEVVDMYYDNLPGNESYVMVEMYRMKSAYRQVTL